MSEMTVPISVDDLAALVRERNELRAEVERLNGVVMSNGHERRRLQGIIKEHGCPTEHKPVRWYRQQSGPGFCATCGENLPDEDDARRDDQEGGR